MDVEDLLGTVDDGRPDRGNRYEKARSSRGPLHDLLTEKLPDFRHETSGVCNLHMLAKVRGITFQAVYKWFGRENRIPYKQANWLIELSANQKERPEGFRPLTYDDLRPFIAN